MGRNGLRILSRRLSVANSQIALQTLLKELALLSDRRQPSLRAMEEIAWVLRSDPKKNEVGFVKRTELTRRERFELDDDWFS
jgi:hypothetical protein